MKKFMAFVFGLLMVFVPFFGRKAEAVGEPTGKRLAVCKDLEKSVRKILTKSKPFNSASCSQGTNKFVKEKKLSIKPFSKVIDLFDAEMDRILKAANPEITLNCHGFAAYAFKRFCEHKVNCFYLHITFKGTAGHDVVLLPQVEGGKTNWYVCDFHSAVGSEGIMRNLFMPLVEFIDRMHNSALGPIEGMTVIDKDSRGTVFGGSACYQDLRVFLNNYPRGAGMQAAGEIVEWEKSQWEKSGCVVLRLVSDDIHRPIDDGVLEALYERCKVPEPMRVERRSARDEFEYQKEQRAEAERRIRAMQAAVLRGLME